MRTTCADVRDEEMQNGTSYAYYVPRRQAGQLSGRFILRAAGDPLKLVALLRERVRTVNPDIVVASAEPMSALFSLMGVYGVTARNVASRTREMGIRLALGARRGGIMGLVMGQAIRLSALGALVGVLVSLVATRGIEAYLWGVARTDAATLVAIAVGLGGASLLAALAPGLRAARVQPVEALRDE